jgi:hypothetical protein
MSRRVPTLPLVLALLAASILALALAAPGARADSAVNAPIATTPVTPVGTILLVHGGGWAGPDSSKQEALMQFPGQVFVDRGWRTVSIDYAAGTDGLQSVKDAIGAELVDPARTGPLCIYGESAGAHLALIAASQMPSVDCVIAFGTPTDFSTYRAQAEAEGDSAAVGTYDTTISAAFGDPATAPDALEPVRVASAINADVLLVRQADDQIVPKGQLDQLVAALPIVDTLITLAGDLTDPGQKYLHGTLDDAARAQLAGALGSFADRAVARAPVETWARAQHCADANAALNRIGVERFRQAVTCLVNRVRSSEDVSGRVRSADTIRRGRRAAARVIGQITAARVVFSLTRSRTGRAVLLAPATQLAASVRAAAKSAVTLKLR